MPAPVPITAGTPNAPAAPAGSAPAATSIPVDVHVQIQAVFQTRQLITEELVTLQGQRKDVGRKVALAYSSDVAANGVDPAKAVTARDAWQTQDNQFGAQEGALKDLLKLVESRIEEFKRTNKTDVSGVLRDQIASLSQELSQQEKAEISTEHQLKVLWDELRDVDPGCLAAMAKESSPRLGNEPKKTPKSKK